MTIPGACALINSLICSGIDTSKFTFLGFLSLNKKIREKELEEIKKSKKTVIIYEAPHKLQTTINDLQKILEKDRKVTLAREITKIHEEFIRGNIDEVKQKSQDLKGEMVIIIEGSKIEKEPENDLNKLSLDEHYKFYEKQGFTKKEIIKKISKDRNVAKNDIYQYFI